MVDNLTQRNSPDSKRVNVNEVHEVRYWTQQLGVSEEELKQAVKAAGTSAEAIREHLQRRQQK